MSSSSIGVELGALQANTPSSQAWGTGSMARAIPFIIPAPIAVQKMFWYNGNNIAGNIDIGICTEYGILVGSAGSTPQIGANTLQEVALGNIILGTGKYYMILSSDSATAEFTGFNLSVPLTKMLGCIQGTSAFPLPPSIASVTITSVTVGMVPIFGLSTRATVS